ncbi:MlaD family protein [Nocardia sp. NPDC055321]
MGTAAVVGQMNQDERLRLVLVTEQVGDGVVAGTPVRLDGVQVGSVESIDIGDAGRQQVTVRLDSDRLRGVTDSLHVSYAPSNLFGISELGIERWVGGTPLRDGQLIDLTGDRAQRIQDVTMGNLIRSLSRTTTEVLTPELAETLATLAADLEAFTPLLEAMITTGRAVADTQQLPASFLLNQYASTLAGGAPMIAGTVQILDTLTNIDILQTRRPLFDVTIKTAVNELFPGLAGLLFTAQRYGTDYTDMATPLLTQLARTVPDPALSSAQLQELIARLNSAFTETPAGTALDLALTLRGMPAISVPLLGSTPGLGGGR